VAETTLELMLAVNRALEMLFHNSSVVDQFFGGWRAWAWTVLAVGYGIYFSIGQKPVLFNGLLFAWFIRPHFGYYTGANESEDVSDLLLLFR
jgi:uncharacterized oligopeptide transporter (OPT) family protein